MHDYIFNIVLDGPNTNGRTYPRDMTIEAFDEALKDGPMPIRYQLDYDEYPNPLKICGELNKIEVVNNSIIGYYTLFQTPQGKIVEALKNDGVNLKLITIGMGIVNNDIVTDFKLTGVAIDLDTGE